MPAIDVLQSRIGDTIASILANTANATLEKVLGTIPRQVESKKIEGAVYEGGGPYALVVPLAPINVGTTRWRNTKRKQYRFAVRFVLFDYQGAEEMELMLEQAVDQVFADPDVFFAAIDDQEGNLVAKDGILEPSVNVIATPADDRLEVEVGINVTVQHVLPMING